MKKKEKIRKVSRKERWAKKCSKCKDAFIPNEYTECDYCFLSQFNFSTRHDALDHLGLSPLIPEDEVLRVLRIIKDGIYVHV